MQLSKRMAAVADMAGEAGYLADIGTDHAYVPIYLAGQGRLVRAIAMDINPGPLKRAQEHIRQYHLEEKIETRLSDGAEKLAPGEADTVILAGMGGRLMTGILERGQKQLAAVETFVLQPQSETEEVRRYLHGHGFCILDENMVKDEGKFYLLIKAKHGQESAWSDGEYRYGRYLIRRGDACFLEYLQKEEHTLAEILERLQGRREERAAARAAQIREDLALIRRVRLDSTGQKNVQLEKECGEGKQP